MKQIVLFTLCFVALATSTAHGAWQGEWGAWEKSNQGAGLKIKSCDEKSCKFLFTSEDGAGHTCVANGILELKSETDAQGKFDPSLKTKSCALLLAQSPEKKMRATLEGADCLRICTAEKAKKLPAELSLLSDWPFEDILPWPDCQTDERVSVKALCRDPQLGHDFIEATAMEAKAKALQLTFYVSKTQQVDIVEDSLKSCTNEEGLQDCLSASVAKKLEAAKTSYAQIRSLKSKHESDLKTSTKNKEALESLKGSYSRKFKSGTTSGDKFEVTDDMKIGSEEDDLSFDVLLNFFDEKECTLSGLAKPTKAGRFVFRDSGKGKGADKNCKLVIFKEGSDLVLADDPPNSCRSHCGKGGSFFGARFPLSSRK
jgi:hypothetical protein